GLAFPLALHTLARHPPPENLLHFPVGPSFGWLDVLGLLVLVGLPHAVGSDVWAKVLSARRPEDARRAALGASLSKLVFGLSAAAVARAGVVAGVGGEPAALFPRTVLQLAPAALAPLVLVALVATMQSSSDSVLLSAAAATSHDLLAGRGSAVVRRSLV